MPDMVVKAGDLAELNVAAYNGLIQILPTRDTFVTMQGNSIVSHQGQNFSLQSDVEDVLIPFDYATPDYPNQGSCHVKFNMGDVQNKMAQASRGFNTARNQMEAFILKGEFFDAKLTFDRPAFRSDASSAYIPHELAITYSLNSINVLNGLQFRLAQDPFFVHFT